MNRRLIVVYPDRNSGEQQIVKSFIQGLENSGQSFTISQKTGFDESQIGPSTILVTGRLAASDHLLRACARKKADFVYFDKGYTHRGWGTQNKGYMRFSLNSLHPLDYFQDVPRPPDRWEKLGIKLKPPRKNGRNIIFAGCTTKFANFHGLDPVEYAKNIVNSIRKITDKPIIHRPKPGARNDENYNPVPNTMLSNNTRTIEQELKDAYALVTFSSNAAIDAMIAGVPAFVLGPGIGRPIANTDLKMLNSPFFPPEEMRYQFFCDLAYCQWNGREIEEGLVWQDLKKILKRIRKKSKAPEAVESVANNSPS